MRVRRKTDRGVALLSALMGIALMTIIVMEFTSSVTLGYRAAANQANSLRADYLARSGVNIGFALLAQHARDKAESQAGAAVGGASAVGGAPAGIAGAVLPGQNSIEGEALNQAWAIPYPPLAVGGGYASVSIVDEERKLDINLLVNPDGSQNTTFEPILERLFVLLNVSLDIIPAIIDWLDPDSVPDGPTGAEADFYMKLFPPYAPRNGMMPTIGDLRMVRGIDDITFHKLSQFLTTYSDIQPAPNQPPVMPPVNFNTAPPEVIAALDPDLGNSPSLINQLMQRRVEQPITADELAQLPGVAAGSANVPGGTLFTLQSQLFTIEGWGTYAGARKLVFATVLQQTGVAPLVLLEWHED
jgi:type II secretory pathway component PulK